MELEALADASPEEQMLYPRVLKSFHLFMLGEGRSESTAKSYMRSVARCMSDHGKSLAACASTEYQWYIKALPENKMKHGQLAAGVKCFMEFWEREGAAILSEGREFQKVADSEKKTYSVLGRGEVTAPKQPEKEKVAVTVPKYPETETRGPGRPPKTEEIPLIEKRGPGRPRKTEEIPLIEKRGPGRPRKTVDIPLVDEVQKRGPGRPPKMEDLPPAKMRKLEEGTAVATVNGDEGLVEEGTAVATVNGDEGLVEEYDGFVLRYVGGLWTVLPDDVVSIDIPSVASRSEASGWKCTSSETARCTLSGEKAEITIHAEAGKMEIRTEDKEIVLRAAQCLVDAWLVELDC